MQIEEASAVGQITGLSLPSVSKHCVIVLVRPQNESLTSF
jgi:hypothetical protein